MSCRREAPLPRSASDALSPSPTYELSQRGKNPTLTGRNQMDVYHSSVKTIPSFNHEKNAAASPFWLRGLPGLNISKRQVSDGDAGAQSLEPWIKLTANSSMEETAVISFLSSTALSPYLSPHF